MYDIKTIVNFTKNENNQIEIFDFDVDDFNYLKENEHCNYKSNLELIEEALSAMFLYDFSIKDLNDFINRKSYEIVYEGEIIKIDNPYLDENTKIYKLNKVLSEEIYRFLKDKANTDENTEGQIE